MKKTGKILVIDDDPAMRSLMSFRLEDKGYKVDLLESGEQVLERMEAGFDYDLVLLDLMLPGINGIEVLQQIKKEYSACQTIIMTGHPSVKTGVEAIKTGAFDFICKPFDIEQLLQIVHNSLESQHLRQENERLRQTITPPTGFSDLVGQSSQMKEIRKLIRLTAASRANVLIMGESGTGKEVVAQAIHNNSELNQGPFVVVNCGAIPSALIESELFGHEKGAYTDAIRQTKGKFEQAQNGTIFLDEISELPLESQVKLLRVIQEKEVTRIGGSQRIQLHIRIIAATNKNLNDCIQDGRFREDLYYRIALFLIDLPGLNERGDDIILLANHFLKKYSKLEARDPIHLGPTADKLLKKKSWSGHVRELENCLYRTILHNPDKNVLSANELQFLPNDNGISKRFFAGEIKPFVDLEAAILREALFLTHGNVSEAAQKLKMARGTLYRKIKTYDIDL